MDPSVAKLALQGPCAVGRRMTPVDESAAGRRSAVLFISDGSGAAKKEPCGSST